MEVTSFSKSGEHEIRNRKEENNMDENTKKRLDQQFAFIREIDREKFIGRQTYLSDGSQENDAPVPCKYSSDYFPQNDADKR